MSWNEEVDIWEVDILTDILEGSCAEYMSVDE